MACAGTLDGELAPCIALGQVGFFAPPGHALSQQSWSFEALLLTVPLGAR